MAYTLVAGTMHPITRETPCTLVETSTTNSSTLSFSSLRSLRKQTNTLYIDAITVDVTTSATAGNREWTVEIQDGSGNVIHHCHSQDVQTAGVSDVHVTFARGGVRSTSAPNTAEYMEILPEGFTLFSPYSLVTFDAADIDTADDDITVRIIGRIV